MAKVTMPQLGESVAEGTIGKWLKQPGDHVAKYEPLLEVITDKVNAEVPSPFEGMLTQILAEEGAVVPNNAEIAIIETADEPAPTARRSGRAPTAPAATSDRSPARPGRPPRRPSPAPARRSRTPRPRSSPTGPAGSDERGPCRDGRAAARPRSPATRPATRTPG